jgi:putative addiction module component
MVSRSRSLSRPDPPPSDARPHAPVFSVFGERARRRSESTLGETHSLELSPRTTILRYTEPMTDDAKILSRKAQALSPNDRIALIEEVLESLDKPDPEVESLWMKEAADRLAAYRRGDLSARDLSDIAAKYRS